MATSEGNPEDASKHANSAVAAGFKLSHRRRAMLADVWDKLAARGDFRDKLERQAMEDPRGFIDWLGKQLPADPVDKAPGSGTFNVGALFLAAAQQARPLPEPIMGDVLDVTPEPVLIEALGTDGVQW